MLLWALFAASWATAQSDHAAPKSIDPVDHQLHTEIQFIAKVYSQAITLLAQLYHASMHDPEKSALVLSHAQKLSEEVVRFLLGRTESPQLILFFQTAQLRPMEAKLLVFGYWLGKGKNDSAISQRHVLKILGWLDKSVQQISGWEEESGFAYLPSSHVAYRILLEQLAARYQEVECRPFDATTATHLTLCLQRPSRHHTTALSCGFIRQVEQITRAFDLPLLLPR